MDIIIQRSVSQIFKIRPSQWGLRGDPYLWDDFEKHFSNFLTPYSEDDFLKEFYEAFIDFTGYSFNHNQNLFIEAYNHGGISSGRISKEFWSSTAIPLLLERLEQINCET